jgi:hypothetical protein
MSAKHRLAWVVIGQRQLARRREAGALGTSAEVFARIGCEH